uniref:Uncharacterized protein n=1 Tax=Anguilla anguilla TaxID=7936 RepID=A0A0E9RH54_ANGAN
MQSLSISLQTKKCKFILDFRSRQLHLWHFILPKIMNIY